MLTPNYAPARPVSRVYVALLPVNGLQIRPQLNKQVVMNADQAADLTAVLRPHLTIPTTTPAPAGRPATGYSPRPTATPRASPKEPAASHPTPQPASWDPASRSP
jgi:hypothetical protein